MFCYMFNILFCVVAILLCIHLSIVSSHAIKCVELEKQALIKFRVGLIGGNQVLDSWKGESCCEWEGISCDNLTGHVTSLVLQGFGVGGKLDPSICELQHLTSLSVNDNYLEGKIPKCIGSLSQLIELDLADNNFVSVIPSTLGNLSNLESLKLRYNPLFASDLEWLSHLSNLRYLDMGHVNLSRVVDWVKPISKLLSLSELHLDYCGLQHVDPQVIPYLNYSTSLKFLDLQGSNLNSSILTWVLNVSKDLTHLYLSDNAIEGSIPKTIWSLCQLKKLKLDSNKLSGKIEDNMRQLYCASNKLEELYLGDNPFNSGPLPDFSWLSKLRKISLPNTNIVGSLSNSFLHLPFLESLDLSHNQLNGVDTINEPYLSNLMSLYLGFNSLSGSFPLLEITKLSSLEDLDLSHNELNGSLPYTISQLSGLLRLSLSSNKLNGVINELHLSNLSLLEHLDVCQNSFSFDLSSNWVPPFQLETFHASMCTLGPKFPTWLKHFRELLDLEISNCGISDSFPEWFWGLTLSLRNMNVSRNKLYGALPKSFLGLNIKYNNVWDFSFNNLSGSLPSFPELHTLVLSNNMFSGSLSSFCSSSPLDLTYLDLSSNLLEGPVSDCWGKFQHLRVLSLEKNNLSGKIPNSFGSLRRIESIHLKNNNFSGEIPSLAFCTNLNLIDVGDNNLQGTLPMWIGLYLHQLVVLSLRGNKFQGDIPISFCNLSFLQVLDLSENKITGKIPKCFSRINALSDMEFPRKLILYFSVSYVYMNNFHEVGSFSDKATLAWKGANREYGKNLGLMTIIDLSCNYLTGEIPQSITKLAALHGLNLSSNNLTGFIPDNIGEMKMLESLDLSKNQLCGKMPTSFSNLNYLSCLNLSFNNLSGRIPSGTQLQTFDVSAYQGNNGLCGPPLTNHCHGDVNVVFPSENTIKHGDYDDEDEVVTFGFYISLVLGFFVGFWGVCGTLVIKPSWRHDYFQFFDNMNDRIHGTLVVFMTGMKRTFQVQN